MQHQRRDKLAAAAEAGGGGDDAALVLRSTEHASMGLQVTNPNHPPTNCRINQPTQTLICHCRCLQMRLQRGQGQDDRTLAALLNQLGGGKAQADVNVPPGQLSAATHDLVDCINPLCELADSKYAEIQRNVAAALYSLSINEENKTAFLPTSSRTALPTLIMLSRKKDIDVRRSVAGAMYRLATHPKLKRPMVKASVLPVLLDFGASSHPEVQRFAMYALKEVRARARVNLAHKCV